MKKKNLRIVAGMMGLAAMTGALGAPLAAATPAQGIQAANVSADATADECPDAPPAGSSIADFLSPFRVNPLLHAQALHGTQDC